MWIITQEGFYSVTAYDPHRGAERADSGELIIARTRAREVLERITRWIGDDISLRSVRSPSLRRGSLQGHFDRLQEPSQREGPTYP